MVKVLLPKQKFPIKKTMFNDGAMYPLLHFSDKCKTWSVKRLILLKGRSSLIECVFLQNDFNGIKDKITVTGHFRLVLLI